MNKVRGFVTLATGNEYYYKLAFNMLRSYKLWNKEEKYRFAILCDRENEYTREFDDVIIISPKHGNYASKFELLLYSPYQENIFIEPDCLIYRNISCLWEYLSDEFDFTAFGWNDGDTNIWFTKDVSDYLGVENIPVFNPGYLFVRPGNVCKKIYEDCIVIADYLKTQKNTLPKCYVGETLRDDPVLAVAMKYNQCLCPAKPKVGKLLSLPSENLISAHISKGICITESCEDGNLLHFSTKRTRQGLYMQQVLVMELCNENAPKWKISLAESRAALSIFMFYCKVRNYLKEFLRSK